MTSPWSNWRGRPGHRGYFPIEGLPLKGEKGIARAGVVRGLADAVVEFIDEDGLVLFSAPMAPPVNAPPEYPTLYGDVTIPSVPYTVVLRGVDSHGTLRNLHFADGDVLHPQSIRVDLRSIPGTFVPGTEAAVDAVITNHGKQKDAFTLQLTDSMGNVTRPSTTTVDLDAGQEAIVPLVVPVPRDLSQLRWSGVINATVTGQAGTSNRSQLRFLLSDVAGSKMEIDLRPGSCENPILLSSQGLLPVAILGTSQLDASSVPLESILLLGTITPLKVKQEDVGSPPRGSSSCPSSVKDGRADLLLFFKIGDISAVIEDLRIQDQSRDRIRIPLIAEDSNGTPLVGNDAILLLRAKSDASYSGVTP